jgi:hypothetical protein
MLFLLRADKAITPGMSLYETVLKLRVCGGMLSKGFRLSNRRFLLGARYGFTTPIEPGMPFSYSTSSRIGQWSE